MRVPLARAREIARPFCGPPRRPSGSPWDHAPRNFCCGWKLFISRRFFVSGYFWHITDVHYDASYVATADYTQSEYIIILLRGYHNTLCYAVHVSYDDHRRRRRLVPIGNVLLMRAGKKICAQFWTERVEPRRQNCYLDKDKKINFHPNKIQYKTWITIFP